MKVFKNYKKLKPTDLSELLKRMEQINAYVYLIQSLNMAKAVWVNSKIQELGLDLEKQYQIDLKKGYLIPVPGSESQQAPQFKPQEPAPTKEKK